MSIQTLVPCKSCKTAVSKKAAVCPQCGRGRPAGGTTTGVFLLIGLVLLLIGGYIIWSAMSSLNGIAQVAGLN